MNEAPPDPRGYRPGPEAFAGRAILVTGAGSGIGRALALACAAAGAQVVLLGRRSAPLEAVYDAILAAGGPRPAIAVLDFERADAAQYAALAESLEREYGRLDGLAQVAAQLGERAPVEHYDVATWMRVMHVNVNAAFILTRTLLPLLRASPDASVVFTTADVGRRGRAYWGAYAASKFAVEGLAQLLADETDTTTRVRVNCVDPGAVRTPLRARAFPGEDPASLPEPAAVLGPFLYLLGPESRGVTGRRFECR